MENEIIYREEMSAKDFVNANKTHLPNRGLINKNILKQYFPKALDVLSNLGYLTVDYIYSLENEKKSLLALCSFFANSSDFMNHKKYLEKNEIGNYFEKTKNVKSQTSSRTKVYQLGKFLQEDNNNFDLFVNLAMFKRSQ